MDGWTNRRVTEALGIAHPIIQAPMAGADSPEMTIAVSEAGGLGSLACATLSIDGIRSAVARIRQSTQNSINLNFFCHTPPAEDTEREGRWRDELSAYFAAFGVDAQTQLPFVNRAPFDADLCAVVEDLKPEVVSFHFGLPAPDLLARVKATGAVILSSATSVAEALWLEVNGCDMVIAQGAEAGGHRGMFLTQDITTQTGTFALVPQIVDAVKIPVIAAGGIADGRGVAAAMMLGADAVQVGTAYLFCPEARLNWMHAKALTAARDDNTALTNVFTGRPARGLVNRLMRDIGPMSDLAPDFPTAGRALAGLRAAAEALGRNDFTNLWAGQAAALSQAIPAGELTRKLAEDAQRAMARHAD